MKVMLRTFAVLGVLAAVGLAYSVQAAAPVAQPTITLEVRVKIDKVIRIEWNDAAATTVPVTSLYFADGTNAAAVWDINAHEGMPNLLDVVDSAGNFVIINRGNAKEGITAFISQEDDPLIADAPVGVVNKWTQQTAPFDPTIDNTYQLSIGPTSSNKATYIPVGLTILPKTAATAVTLVPDTNAGQICKNETLLFPLKFQAPGCATNGSLGVTHKIIITFTATAS